MLPSNLQRTTPALTAVAILTLSLALIGDAVALTMRAPAGSPYHAPRIDPGMGGGYNQKKSLHSNIALDGPIVSEPQPHKPRWKNQQGGLIGGAWPPPRRPYPCAPGYYCP